MLRKILLIGLTTLLGITMFTGCTSGNPVNESSPKTRIYKGENGDIEVPDQPKRIAMLASTYAGNLLHLGITPVAVNEWPKRNKFYEGKLDKAEVITEDSLEKLLALKPDLIITFSNDKNLAKYKKIAPTVALTYEKYDYLEQHIEIGKIVGKEKEARQWVEQWKEKVKLSKNQVQSSIGKDATATVLETYGKDMYVYGKNWGRGTEIIYQALGLKPTDKLRKDVFGTGYKAISTEVIPEYAGDYIFVGEGGQTNNSFMETDIWKNIPAVKNGHVIKFDSDSFYFNDPISLEKELDFIVKALTKDQSQS